MGWMCHQTWIVVYIEFAWNYTGFNSNYYYFTRITQLWKSQNYTNKFQNNFSVGDSWIPVWFTGCTRKFKFKLHSFEMPWRLLGKRTNSNIHRTVTDGPFAMQICPRCTFNPGKKNPYWCAGLEKVPISPWLLTLLHICGVTPTPQLPRQYRR